MCVHRCERVLRCTRPMHTRPPAWSMYEDGSPAAHTGRPPRTAGLQRPSLPPRPSLCQAYSEWGSQISPGGMHLGCSPSLGPPGWLSEDLRVLVAPPWSRLTPPRPAA